MGMSYHPHDEYPYPDLMPPLLPGRVSSLLVCPCSSYGAHARKRSRERESKREEKTGEQQNSSETGEENNERTREERTRTRIAQIQCASWKTSGNAKYHFSPLWKKAYI
eukprot:754673-Hanusia_phi.AAC.3